MTLEEAKERVANLERIKSDDEAAHSAEDTLYIDFVYHVAEKGNDELSQIAKEILKSISIDFARWCA